MESKLPRSQEADKGTCGLDQRMLGGDPFLGCSLSLSPGTQNGLKGALGSMHREVIKTVGKEGSQVSREHYLELLHPTPVTCMHPMSVPLPDFIICKARSSVRIT